jgi:hypothetical protein
MIVIPGTSKDKIGNVPRSLGAAPMWQGASARQVLGRLFNTFARVTFRLPDAAGGGFLNSTEHQVRPT